MTRPSGADGAFDAAICAGNSLALAADRPMVQRTIERMLAAVRPGGIVLVHVLNLWRLPDGPCVWQKCQRANLPEGEVLIVKGVHRCGRQGFVDLVVAGLTPATQMHTESIPLLGLEAEELEQMTLRRPVPPDANSAAVTRARPTNAKVAWT